MYLTPSRYHTNENSLDKRRGLSQQRTIKGKKESIRSQKKIFQNFIKVCLKFTKNILLNFALTILARKFKINLNNKSLTIFSNETLMLFSNTMIACDQKCFYSNVVFCTFKSISLTKIVLIFLENLESFALTLLLLNQEIWGKIGVQEKCVSGDVACLRQVSIDRSLLALFFST